MSVAIITGSAGLIGSEASRYFAEQGLDVVGIDNDLRRHFFGEEASTRWQRARLEDELGERYQHVDADIRDADVIGQVFRRYGKQIALVIHTAAQPSHDWAANEPATDFTVNAVGTMNVLEATRQFAQDAVFIFTSTNKVYGDTPNRLPLVELDTRWEIDPNHAWLHGVPEEMSIDQSLHSLFGASKVAADVLVQEYGRYFGMKTACFRGGCLTGPNHSGAQLHGFLAYLMKCAATASPYTVFGYGGKQVRDNIHSADLVQAFGHVFRNPRCGEVYNIGGSRFSNCSMLEAIELCSEITGMPLEWTYREQNRTGDHVWWISDVAKFQQHYPTWQLTYDVPRILREIYEFNAERWPEAVAK
jgi:CDP-paratose 2-epimerase